MCCSLLLLLLLRLLLLLALCNIHIFILDTCIRIVCVCLTVGSENKTKQKQKPAIRSTCGEKYSTLNEIQWTQNHIHAISFVFIGLQNSIIWTVKSSK